MTRILYALVQSLNVVSNLSTFDAKCETLQPTATFIWTVTCPCGFHPCIRLMFKHYSLCIRSLTMLNDRFTRGGNCSLIHNFYTSTIDSLHPFLLIDV